MSRVLAIVGLVVALMATGVAFATPEEQIRHPTMTGNAEPPGGDAGSVRVLEGDHLWKISARRLGDNATNEEISPYWRQVVVVNTPRLRSGDPDLIYPGEIVKVPPTP
ncbi:MAG TPA: hypothetical protein VMM14_05770 [Acidimicrobiia bacterium]|nr:hypothetical protein [Acidimicrobiia bacterium]